MNLVLVVNAMEMDWKLEIDMGSGWKLEIDVGGSNWKLEIDTGIRLETGCNGFLNSHK